MSQPSYNLVTVQRQPSYLFLGFGVVLMAAFAALIWRTQPTGPLVVDAPTMTPDGGYPTVAARLAAIEANQATATVTPTRTRVATATVTPPVTSRYAMCGETDGPCILPSPTLGGVDTLPTIPPPTIPACPSWVPAPGYPDERLCVEGGQS